MTRALRDLPAPTLRLYLLALSVTIALGLGMLAPAFIGVAAAGAAALIAACFADYIAAVRPIDFEVERRHHPRLYLAADNGIELAVANHGRRPLNLRLRDTPPPAFRSSTLFVGGAIAPAEVAIFRYTTRPLARGQYGFGTITARWATSLRLLWRQRSVDAQEGVSGYRNLAHVEMYDLVGSRWPPR